MPRTWNFGLKGQGGRFDLTGLGDLSGSMRHWLRDTPAHRWLDHRPDIQIGTRGDDVMPFDAASHAGPSFLNGARGEDTLALNFSAAEWQSLAGRLDGLFDRFADRLDAGKTGMFHFRPLDLRATGFENATLTVDGQTLTLRDDPVRAANDAFAGNTDGPITGNVLGNDLLPDLLRKVKLVGEGPAEGTLHLARDGSFTFDPSTGFVDLPVGTSREVTFRYVAIDADGDRDRASVTLTVEALNHAPVAHDMTIAATDAADGYRVEVAPDFTDPDFADRHSLSLDIDWASMGSAEAYTHDGKIVFEAVGFEHLAEGETAVRTFDFTVEDAAGERSTASVTATITGTNQAPITYGVGASGLEDAAVIAADAITPWAIYDPDNGDSHTVAELGAVNHGSAAISADGTQILFTPEADFSGVGTVEYRVADALGATSDLVTAQFHVSGIADTPEIRLEAEAGARADQFYVAVTGISTDRDLSEVFNEFRLEVLDANGNLLANQSDYLDVSVIHPASATPPFSQDGSETVRFLVTLPAGAGQDISLRATAQVWDPSGSGPAAMATATDTLDVTWSASSNNLSRDYGFSNHSIWASTDNQRHEASVHLAGEFGEDTSFGGQVFYADLTGGSGFGPKAHISSAFDVEAEFDVDVKSTAWVEGGGVSGGLNFQARADVLHNELTDQIRFDTSAHAVPGWSWFEAGTPNAGFDVRLMDGNVFFDAAMKVWGYAHLKAGVDTFGPTFTIPPYDVIPEFSVDMYPLLGSGGLSLAAWDGYRLSSLNGAVSVAASNASGTIKDKVFGNEIVDWAVSRPSFTTRSDNFDANSVFSSLKSQQIASLAFDVDGIAATVAGKPDPVSWSFEYPDGFVSSYVNFKAWIDILDIDLVEALSYGQRHVMTPGALTGTLVMENGDRFDFTFGDAIEVGRGSDYDANGDGEVAYHFELTPQAQFRTEASLIFQEYDRLRLLDAGVSGTIGFNTLGSQSLGIGTGGYWKTYTGNAIDRSFTQGLTAQDFALDLDTVTSGTYLV